MAAIHDYLASDHRHCDESLAKMEEAISKNNWENATLLSKEFITSMLRHFNCEENILFPAFEDTTGMTQGPTMMMRMEHEQMKEMLDELSEAIEQKNIDRALGTSETLMIYIQQHNGKEEQILYNMCDMHLAHLAPALVGEMKNILK